MSVKKALPSFNARALFAPDTIKKEERTVEVVWTTGERVLRGGYFSDPYWEELAVDESSIRMNRLNSGAPLLNSHSQRTLQDQIGVVEKAWVIGGEGRAIVRFSEREDVEPIWKDVQAGIIRNISVGYRIHRFEETPLKGEDGYSVYRATDWEPLEISFVPVGADAQAGARSQAEGEVLSECVIIRNLDIVEERNLEEEREEMDKKIDTTAADAAALENAARAEGAKNERARIAGIEKAVRAAKLDQSLAEQLISSGETLEAARALVLEKLAEKDQSAGVRNTDIEITRDATETRAEGMREALAHRVNHVENPLTEKGRAFRGMSLIRMAEEIVGQRARGMSRSELSRAAMSTSDFGDILANVATKSLLKAYTVQRKTFEPFVVKGTLPDYKDASRVQFGEVSSLDSVAEGKEFETGSIGDGKETVRLGKYGKIIRITEETIINDDLNALGRLPVLMGNAAARLESKLVYTDTLIGNPTMGDSVALFHASHANLMSAAAITVASLGLAEKAMLLQMGLDAKDYVGAFPAFLIVGADKKVEAQTLLAPIQATQASNVNPYVNALTLIVDPRITTTKWFLAANPSEMDTIEVSTLEGMSGPELVAERDFDTGGFKWRIKHVVGVKALDYRGLVYNPGA